MRHEIIIEYAEKYLALEEMTEVVGCVMPTFAIWQNQIKSRFVPRLLRTTLFVAQRAFLDMGGTYGISPARPLEYFWRTRKRQRRLGNLLRVPGSFVSLSSTRRLLCRDGIEFQS
jgi:hypothetical protein